MKTIAAIVLALAATAAFAGWGCGPGTYQKCFYDARGNKICWCEPYNR